MKYRNYELLFISTPPFAYLSMFYLRNKYSILIWDVYPDSFKIYGFSERNLIYRFWAWGNRKVFRKAYRIFTIGEKMADLVSQYIDHKKIAITPLWTTFSNYESIPKEENIFIKEHSLANKFIVQYSGNIGVTHNVEVLVDVAKKMQSEEHVFFVIIGKGERLEMIKSKIRANQLQNCLVLPFQSDEMFPYSLSAADLGVVILNEKTSQGSVPSKTYNLMTSGKPILYIASPDSELSLYAERYKNGKCYLASQTNEIASFIKEISLNAQLKEELIQNSIMASKKYSRANADYLVQKYINV